MRSTLITSFIVAIILLNSSFVQAEEDALVQKLDQFKSSLRSYFIGAPRPNFRQKIQIGRILRAHRATLREDCKELRSTILAMKKEFRQHLTREQLLTLLDKKDEFSMLPPGFKIAKALKRLEREDRVQLLQLGRQIWRGPKANIGVNVRNFRDFVQNNIHPYIQKELNLTAEQQAIWQQIVSSNDEKLDKLSIKIVFKLHHLRDKVKEVLSAEQITFIETNRDKIFQEVLSFVSEL